MKRLIACLAATTCIALLLAASALARGGTAEPKPPTISVKAANRFAKQWAGKTYAKPVVLHLTINRQGVTATFTFEKLQPCKLVGGKEPYFKCGLLIHDFILQENGYEETVTLHKSVALVVAAASRRKFYESELDDPPLYPLEIYPIRNPYLVFVSAV